MILISQKFCEFFDSNLIFDEKIHL